MRSSLIGAQSHPDSRKKPLLKLKVSLAERAAARSNQIIYRQRWNWVS
jgi:hypothetical protein